MSKSKPDSSQLGRALSVLNKIGRTLTAIEDPKEVLEQIATDAKDVLDADIVDLYEYNQARREFTLPPVLVGNRRDPFVPKYKIFDDDVVFKVVKGAKPQYFPDAQNAEPLTESHTSRTDAPDNRFVIREGVHSSVSLPLQAGTETVGVMFVNYRTPQEFGGEQKDLIESFSNLAAIAIYNSRLWKLQNNQLAALKEIIDVIGAENPLEPILKQAVSLFSASYGSISRLTEDGQYLQYKSQVAGGSSEVSPAEDTKRPATEGITGHVVRSGKPFRTGNVNEVGFYAQWYSSTKSEMAIPLMNAFDGIIGVLNLESDYPDFFTEEHQKLCESFANAASAAIQQSDLIENTQSLHALTEWHNLKELLDGMLKNLVKMMGANTASSVNLYDKKNNNFYAFHGVGPSQEFVEKYLLVPPRPDGTGRYVLETGESLFYDDVKNISGKLPKVREEAWDQEIGSFAVLPLTYQEEILGTLFIHKIGEQIRFTEDARRILQTYATQTALAIHNVQHRVDIEPLKDILSATVSEHREEILNRIVERAVHIMASDYASLWLAQKETGELVRQAIYVRPEEKEYLNLQTRRIFDARSSINMAVYTTGKPAVVSDVAIMEKEGRYNRIYEKARSEIAVPLIFRDEIIGTLNTESQNLGAFSELDMATLRVIADVATIAIKVVEGLEELSEVNSRITAEVKRKTEELEGKTQELSKRNEELYHMNYRLERRNNSFEALTQISQQLTANVQRGEQEILQIIHKHASQIMDTANMYIALYDHEKKQVSFRLAFMDGKPVDIAPRSAGQGRTEWIINKKSPILNYTREEAENWYKQPDTEEYIGQTFASWLGVPIMFGDEVMGVIATYHRTEEYKYDPDDLKVLTLMGRQAAIALQNARLISQLDDRIVELDKIRELGEELSKGNL